MRYKQNPKDPYYFKDFMYDYDFVVGTAVIFTALWIAITIVMLMAHALYPPEKTDCKYNHVRYVIEERTVTNFIY